jgi:hypothetical protein
VNSNRLVYPQFDPNARSSLLLPKVISHARGVRFDIFEADFAHGGDHCAFEVLIDRVGIDDAALTPIAENIDLKGFQVWARGDSGIRAVDRRGRHSS